MARERKLPPRLAFGPFHLDVSASELRKHRTHLRLSGHALQILEILLECPNQAVGREELQQRLWNDATFVDFDHGLNAAMNRLRRTLGDTADQPRYIETVPGRGYRFIAPVTDLSIEPIAAAASSSSPAE